MVLRPGLLNLPNAISLVRLAAAPFLIVILIRADRTYSVIAAALFIAVSLTDLLDGYAARRLGVVTTAGKFLDPLADKLLVATAFIMLIPLGRVPAWAVALIIGREIAVTGLRAIAVDSGVVIDASLLGKYKTFLQMVCLVPLIIHYSFFGIDFHTIGIILFALALIATVWSGFDYFIRFFMRPIP
ncbi:MAG: CDP-diacylglycerol--glycerol-3-phosphate 3-phosphatidyltransferase [Deltaproteobacteria bacterium]|nr:CDP-diacylglycerol--glycerol-3-phosphate 3-phosphatidyltransferase [Deltaproteobacteria bacterium]